MSIGPGEERERRIFFSWQSDTPSKTNRTIIETALARAAKAAGATWAPSDRPAAKIETAASDVVGARQLADVIFERIRSADAFVADVSLVVQHGKRLMPNPNVLIETGYALHALSDARIVLIANTAFGRLEALPFDLRGRLALAYSMKPEEEPAGAREKLTKDLTGIMHTVLSLPRATQDVRLDVGVYRRNLVPHGRVRIESLGEELITTVRNFSDFPLRLVSFAYEYEEGGFGSFPHHHAPLLAGTIPARDSRQFPLPLSALAEIRKTVRRAVATDSLGRVFASPPGAIAAALRNRNGQPDPSG